MLRIYADFNSCDELGRVQLNTVGSLRDVELHRGALVPGLKVVLYMTDELEVEATLVFDEIWMGWPDWTTVHHTPPA